VVQIRGQEPYELGLAVRPNTRPELLKGRAGSIYSFQRIRYIGYYKVKVHPGADLIMGLETGLHFRT
jgi:hypothetical protein